MCLALPCLDVPGWGDSQEQTPRSPLSSRVGSSSKSCVCGVECVCVVCGMWGGGESIVYGGGVCVSVHAHLYGQTQGNAGGGI